MQKYTLTYFDIRGRAEPSRLVLAYAGVEYADHGVDGEEWQRIKPNSPLGQLPLLVEHRADGDRTWPQSMAILRHLARVHGLEGKDEDERFAADVACETAVDARAAHTTFKRSLESGTDEGKAKYLKETASNHLARFEKLLQDRQWFAGNSVTYADFIVFDTIEKYLALSEDVLADRPRLAAFMRRVAGLPQLQSHLAARKRPA
jgi:glutathione S-transferase